MDAPTTDPLPIRRISEEHWDQLGELIALVFSETEVTPEQRADERSILEFERSFAAFDDDLLCGHTTAYSLHMTVPGGQAVPVAGVTWVGVRPTHRRRGVLASLMRRQLTDLHENGGEAVAALYASEATIYGRFGYGLASHVLDVTVPRRAADLPGAPVDGTLRPRLVPLEDSLAVVEPLYAATVPTRPGLLTRDKAWARHRIFDPPAWRRGATPLQCVVLEDTSQARAYAWYASVGQWDADAMPDGVVRVREVGATDPAAYAAVWRYLLSLDLMTSTEARLPVDDPLLHMLADMRAARASLKDGLYIRLVDVGRALSARAYAAEVDVVLDVTDDFCPWNAGRWRLAAGEGGSRCERTDAPADLALSARDLGAAYLGGVSLRALARAGRVTEHRAGSLAAVSRAFAHDVQPFCAYMF